MRSALISTLLLFLTTACSPIHSANAERAAPKPAPVPPPAAPAAPQRSLPQVVLTPPLLLQILTAEMADAQGNYPLAMFHYLDTARQTRDPRLAQQATRAAIFGKSHSIALQSAQLWVELEPNQPDALQTLASLLLALGHPAEAEPHLRRLLTLLPPAQGGELILKTLSRAPHAAEALAIYDRLLPPASQTPIARYQAALLAHDLRAYDQAVVRLEPILTDPGLGQQAELLRANSWYRQGDTAKALAALARLLEEQPDASNIRLRYARMLIDSEQVAAGYAQLQQLSAQIPDNPEVIYSLGLMAFNQNDYNAAEGYFKQLIKLDNRVDMAHHTLGQMSELQSKPADAMRWYQAVEEGEFYLQAQLRIAVLLAQTQSLPQAREHLAQLRDEENALQVDQVEAELLVQAKIYDEAMVIYDRMLADEPESSDLLYARAMVAERLGRLDQLERDLRQVLTLDPDNSQALNALGYTLADQTDRLQEARELIEHAYRVNPDDPAILDSMGWVFYRLGEHQKALGYLQQAVAKLEDGEILAHLGEVLWVLGQTDAARQQWQRAQAIAPDNPILLKTLQRFIP